MCMCDEQRQATPVVRGREKWEGGLHHRFKTRDFSLSDCRGLSLSLSLCLSLCLSILFFPLILICSFCSLFPLISFSQSSTFALLHLFHVLSLSSASFCLNLSPTVSFLSVLPLSLSLKSLPVNNFPKAFCSGNQCVVSDSAVWGLYLESWLIFLSVVLVALLWAFCGTVPPGWRLGLRGALVVVQSCSSNSAVNRSLPVGQSNYRHVTHSFAHSFTVSLSHLVSSPLCDARWLPISVFSQPDCVLTRTTPSFSLLHQLLSTLRHPVTSLSLSLSHLFSFPRLGSALLVLPPFLCWKRPPILLLFLLLFLALTPFLLLITLCLLWSSSPWPHLSTMLLCPLLRIQDLGRRTLRSPPPFSSLLFAPPFSSRWTSFSSCPKGIARWYQIPLI